MRRPHTTEKFIENMLCSEIHYDGKYNYKLVEYISYHKKIEIYCNECQKSFWQRADHHRNGQGCPLCAGNKKFAIEELLQKLTIEEDPIVVNDEIQCRCSYCKKYFIPTRVQIKCRIGSLSRKLEGEHRLYCSNQCKNNCSLFYQKKYPKGDKPYRDTSRPDQPELRRIVLERDNNQCQRCESIENLHCHHITGVEINPVESADVDNCITLCVECHNKAHIESGCRMHKQKCVVKV